MDVTFHLFGDHLLFRLVSTRRLPGRVALLFYYPRWHYPGAYGTPLPVGDRLVALAKEVAIRRWRARADAVAVFTLDEGLAERWRHARGAPACWFPEPPVAQDLPRADDSERDGIVLYGALAPRKGIDLVVRALTLEPTETRLVLAGAAEPAFLPELEAYAATLARAGVDVDLRAHLHSERDGLAVLARGRAAVLPYPRHAGMSRVLLEACAVGTPVIADEFGLLGHLVRRHGLGLAVDCSNPRALREAIARVSDSAAAGSYSAPLARFAARYSRVRFRSAVLEGLGFATS